MKWLRRKGWGGLGSCQKSLITSRRYGLLRRVANGVAPLVTQAARIIDIANQPLAHFVHRLTHGHARPAVGSMLHDAVVFLGRGYQLAALKNVLRTGFFDVNVLACLSGTYA